MANALIIPGVQVSVVKEVVPKQLSPSGVLGLVGFTERNEQRVERVGSFSRLVDALGRGTTSSLAEARQALDNGVSELVISPVEGGKAARVTLPGSEESESGLTLVARAAGPWANGLKVTVEHRAGADGTTTFDLSIQLPGGGGTEVRRGLRTDTVAEALADSAVAWVEEAQPGLPKAGDEYAFAGGEDAGPSDYKTALDRLQDEPDVDMVLCAVQDLSKTASVLKIYGDVIAHCNAMSSDCKGRIGFGQVPPGATPDACAQLANGLVSDRFVLVAPNGVVGAVAGLVGSLSYYASPTFKRVAGLATLTPVIVEHQKALLRANVVPVVNERGRGTIVLRGLTTDGDQVNVRRVADRAVRTMKMIGDLFIGLLNNADGRGALKQKLVEALVQMEKDGAIVPSTDGKDPAFKVEVYSSQADFALGIVRVSMAVRPVRAIDYIYATITVQV